MVRRVRRYRRKPLRRLRTRFRRTRRRYRRRRLGVLKCKVTRVEILNVTTNDNHSYWMHFTPNKIPEWNELAKNFEKCKFTKVVCRVMPLHNVSLGYLTNAGGTTVTNECPAYCMVPWKGEPQIATKGFTSIMAQDNAKMFRGTQTGYQTYVPAVKNIVLRNSDGPTETLASSQLLYRPTIQCGGDKGSCPIYVGLIMFQGDATLNVSFNYNIKLDVYCTFSNQSMINL